MWIACRGRLDARTSGALKEKVHGMPAGGQHVVVDMAGVEWLDSSGITALLAGYKRADRYGTLFLLHHPSTIVTSALRMARLDSAFEIAQDEDEVWARVRAHAATARHAMTPAEPAAPAGEAPPAGDAGATSAGPGAAEDEPGELRAG